LSCIRDHLFNGANCRFTVRNSDQVRDQLEFLQSKLDCCLVIDGDSLQVCTGFIAKFRGLRMSCYAAMFNSLQE
jgi:hypothetical protein